MAVGISIEAVCADLPDLDTERILLRRLRMDDAADLFEYAQDPQVAQYAS